MPDHLCVVLSRLFPEVNRSALDAGISSWSKVKEATYYTGLTEDRVIETKCRLIADTVAYILSFETYQEGTKAGWWIRLRGLNHFNQPTGVGHALVIVEREDCRHLLIDAYIGCRGLTCREIDIDTFRKKLAILQKYYDPELWYQVTGCYEEEVPDHVKVTITKYSYSDDVETILERIVELEEFRPNIRYGHNKD